MNVTGYIRHKATDGETPDILALKYYSDEYMSSYILEANPNLTKSIYEGGEIIKIPVFDTLENDASLAPWRRS
jgi:phage tail protein X